MTINILTIELAPICEKSPFFAFCNLYASLYDSSHCVLKYISD